MSPTWTFFHRSPVRRVMVLGFSSLSSARTIGADMMIPNSFTSPFSVRGWSLRHPWKRQLRGDVPKRRSLFDLRQKCLSECHAAPNHDVWHERFLERLHAILNRYQLGLRDEHHRAPEPLALSVVGGLLEVATTVTAAAKCDPPLVGWVWQRGFDPVGQATQPEHDDRTSV